MTKEQKFLEQNKNARIVNTVSGNGVKNGNDNKLKGSMRGLSPDQTAQNLIPTDKRIGKVKSSVSPMKSNVVSLKGKGTLRTGSITSNNLNGLTSSFKNTPNLMYTFNLCSFDKINERINQVCLHPYTNYISFI